MGNVERDLNNYLTRVDAEEERAEAVDELASKLYWAAFKAMRLELYSTIYAGKTSAADMDNAIDSEVFDGIAESLMKVIERG